MGTAAVQIARAIGARSIGTARTAAKLERARALGMDDAIVPAEGRFAAEVLKRTGGAGFDVALELVGGGYVPEEMACAAHKARIVVVGLMAGSRADVDLAALMNKRLDVHGTVLRARPLEEKILAAQALQTHLVPLFQRGAMKAVVDRVLPLEDAPKAHAAMQANEGFGKIVLSC